MNILDFFDHMLTINNEKPIMREIVWAITNISAGRINQCEKVMDSAVLERVYDYLTDYDLKLKKEAVFVIRNMCTTGSLEITIKVVDQGVLKKLCELLEKEKNEIILITCLETLLNIFHMGEILKEFEKENRFIKEFDEYAGVTLLENLQNHKDIDIFNLAQKILEMFYITQEVTN